MIGVVGGIIIIRCVVISFTLTVFVFASVTTYIRAKNSFVSSF